MFGNYSFTGLPDSSYTVSPQLAGYFFVPFSRTFASLGTGQASDFVATNQLPSLSDQAFITLLYRNVLARTPDSAGLTFWVNKLTGGEARGGAADEFLRSPEYANYGLFVVSTYLGLLGREPELGGYQYWFSRNSSWT